MLKLRDYQEFGVSDIREAYKKGYNAPLFVLPTGGGKTVVFCHIAQQTASRGKRVLILVHRVELLRQTSSALVKSGVTHGLINPKFTQNLSAPVQVASVQTLIRRLDHMLPPDLIIIDEAHHATAGSWRKVVEHFPNAKILGVTATPIRGDGSGLGKEAVAVFETLIMGPQISELIEHGHLVKPIIYAPKERIDLSSAKIVRGDYDRETVTELINQSTITGDAVKHYTKLCPFEPAVAFCTSVKHAEETAEAFREAGFRSYSIDGSMDDDQRSRILEGLGNGEVHVVTSCDLISEGTDIPAIVCGIFLRPTLSTGLYIQQGGRVLRTSDGKNRAIILDHVGNTLEHGFLDENREWSLAGRKRLSNKEKEAIGIRVFQCQNCFACHEPANACPYCGTERPVKEQATPRLIEGDLVIITDDQKEHIKITRKEEVAAAKTLKDLKIIQNQRGYKRGWAKRVFNARVSKNL